MFGWFKGYRTYICAAGLVAVQVARLMGYPIPTEVDVILGSGAAASIRAAM